MVLTESERVQRMGQISKAMLSPETLVLRIVYRDEKGQRRRRVVSPIKFIGEKAFSALCLCREEPRTFKIERCEEIELLKSDDVLAPVQIEELTE
jgi:predicted DNA-binding transcriptional regulator YafY